MNKLIVSLVFLLSLPAAADVWTPVDSSYKLTFDDEFNGTAVNTNKWNKNWFGSTQTQITKPANSAETAAYDPAQCTVANGYLEMRAVQKTVVDQFGKTWNYATCHLNTMNKFDQLGGYAEVRMYMPGKNGKVANWPGFWANGYQSTCGSWPCAGELDIMEGLGGYAHWHYHGPNNYNPGGGPNTDFSGWHIFAAEWGTGYANFYYDGVKVGSIVSSNIVNKVMAYLLQNSVSPENNYGGPMLVPGTVLVDYVHVYAKDGSRPAVTPEPGYGGPGDTGDVVAADTQAPSIPSGLSGSASSSSQINLSFAASSDNVGVAGYTIFRNGVARANVSGLSFSDTGLSASTTYSYSVLAYDAAGNKSAQSNSINITTQNVVVEPPPPPPPTTTERHFDFGAGSSAAPVASGYVGVPLITYSASLGYGYQSTSGLDSRLRTSTSNALQSDFHKMYNGHFLVDLANGSYEVTIQMGDHDSALSNMSLRAEGQLQFSGVNTSSTALHATRTFTVNVTDGQLDLELFTTNSTSMYYGYFAINSLDIKPAGSDVVVVDDGKDVEAPVVSILSPSSGTTVSTLSTVQISAAASDNVGVTKVEFRVDGYLHCTRTSAPYTCDYTPHHVRKATIEVRAYDSAGNIGSAKSNLNIR